MHHHGSFGVISSVLIFGRATSASRLPYSITPIVFLIRESINRHAGGLKKKNRHTGGLGSPTSSSLLSIEALTRFHFVTKGVCPLNCRLCLDRASAIESKKAMFNTR